MNGYLRLSVYQVVRLGNNSIRNLTGTDWEQLSLNSGWSGGFSYG